MAFILEVGIKRPEGAANVISVIRDDHNKVNNIQEAAIPRRLKFIIINHAFSLIFDRFFWGG